VELDHLERYGPAVRGLLERRHRLGVGAVELAQVLASSLDDPGHAAGVGTVTRPWRVLARLGLAPRPRRFAPLRDVWGLGILVEPRSPLGAEVPGVVDDGHVGVAGDERGQDLLGVVGARVVDEDDLVLDAQLREHGRQPLVHLGDRGGVAVAGDDRAEPRPLRAGRHELRDLSGVHL
jgi:hypothetical protein